MLTRVISALPPCSITTAGLPLPTIFVSATWPTPEPLTHRPLPLTWSNTQPRTCTRPCSATTIADEPTSAITVSSTELLPTEVTTTPAPVGFCTRHCRIASTPVCRASTAVQAAPPTRQLSSAASPLRTSSTGSSASSPVMSKPDSCTAPPATTSVLPVTECRRTVPGPSSALIVTTPVIASDSS